MNQLHIELTNRCTLACPACPRTTWQQLTKNSVAKSDLDIDLFERFMDCDGGRKINKFELCGDYGDCIYYPHLIEFIKRFRSSKTFNIHTNGSYKNLAFWEELASLLTPNDSVIFGIDGLEDTNHLYRRNADWASIMVGVDTIAKSSAVLRWQTIVFNFNYNRLSEIKQFAESKGADFFALKTHRYGDDSLIPPENFVHLDHTFKDEYHYDYNIVIDPRCENEKIITCEGKLFPCDWIRNPKTFYKSQLWKQQSRWLDKVDIKNSNYDQAIEAVKDWANYVRENSLLGSQNVDVLCRMKCREGCSHNIELKV